MTEEEGRAQFFTKIFRTYSSVLFCCAAGIIWLCRPVMHIMKSNYYTAWHFVPFLALASTCSCFYQFLNSVYVVNKKSTHSLWTMLAGAVSNCIMNYFFIKWWGPVGATYASFLGLGVVFTLRAIDAHSMIGMSIHPARVLLNFAVLAGEALVLLAEVPLYGLWTGLITLGIILYSFAGVWAMARILRPSPRPPGQSTGENHRLPAGSARKTGVKRAIAAVSMAAAAVATTERFIKQRPLV